MTRLAGAAVWAVVPFAPEAPFRLYAGQDAEPRVVSDVAPLIRAARKGGDPQLTYLVPGKVRPVLILSDAHDDHLGEYLALRLARFSKLDEHDRELVRRGGSATHFHLLPDDFPGLPEENAAMVAGLVRVDRSAVGDEVLGRLDRGALAELHERVIRFYRLDVRRLVEHRLRELAAAQRRRPR